MAMSKLSEQKEEGGPEKERWQGGGETAEPRTTETEGDNPSCC